MNLSNTDTLYIRANEIQRVSTGSQHLKMPVIDETTTDASIQLVNMDGYLLTGLISHNLRGDADLIVDLNTGITFELMKVLPDVTEEDEKQLSILADKTELEAMINLPAAG
jgi:hypothetical protein